VYKKKSQDTKELTEATNQK